MSAAILAIGKAAISAKGLMAAGTAMAGAGAIQQGRITSAQAKSREAIAEYNAAVQEAEAVETERKTQFEQQRQMETGERIKGTLRAEIAAAGGVTTAGAGLLLQAKQAAEVELQNLLIGYEGMTAAARARSQGAFDVAQAKIYRRRAKTAQKAGYIKAGTTALTGFSKMGL